MESQKRRETVKHHLPACPDKEVGELWRRTQDHLTWPEPLAIEHDVIALIRKLVEERAGLEHLVNIPEGEFPIADWSRARRIEKALADFGIDPATWT